ncbi:FAD-dependent oxidoreductase domain-containing protein 1 [Halotydeus destructor]|nr:FAD-dependent oxidoreductase domain-containing protein 1 [Halotydeus destructor]
MSVLLRRAFRVNVLNRRLCSSGSDNKSSEAVETDKQTKSVDATKNVFSEMDTSKAIGTPPTLAPGQEFPVEEQIFVQLDPSRRSIEDGREESGHWLCDTFRYPQFQVPQKPMERATSLASTFDTKRIFDGKKLVQQDDVVWPHHVDICIIGGGIMGSSIAYWLKQKAPDSFTLCVIERDPKYTHASTTLSVGGIRQQFALPENVLMSLFSADFLRNCKRHLSVLEQEPPDLSFCPTGYLLLAGSEGGAEQLLVNHELQSSCGAYVDLLNCDQMQSRFPWLNTEGVVIGANGVENEGWFDPWSLLVATKAKAEFLGARYVHGEVVDFNPRTAMASQTSTLGDSERCNHLIVRLPDGTERQIEFAIGIIANGAQSGELTRKLGIGGPGKGIRSAPLPIEPRKRYVYVFHCPESPGLDFPFLVDSSGVWVRREGLGGNFVCGKCPLADEEPDNSNLDVDYNYFEQEIWPHLANRVKAFENIKVVGAWAGYYDYNTFDQNPVIGPHPYYHNMHWATGFSGHGIQQAPAVGRAVMEMVLEKKFVTLDLSRFGWNRILENAPYHESVII